MSSIRFVGAIVAPLLVLFLVGCGGGGGGGGPAQVKVTLRVHVEDIDGSPVQNCDVEITIAGDNYQAQETQAGVYEAELTLPVGGATGGQITVTPPANSGLQDAQVALDIPNPNNPPEPVIVLAMEPPPPPPI